ncbi:MAG: MmcQ/YjbR family DNA-binding protein [Ruminococcaceae bacterium]|nr:MmcQ/YjbR family DNA-binding protein [Oscillospiraceae bacterium]
MRTRQEVIDFCLSFNDTYEDYPFHDVNWTIMRHKGNQKMFAAIYERMGNIWINVKCDPDFTYIWRSTYAAVIPAYHMNKWHWNSIILDGTVPTGEIKNMIGNSYELTKPKRKGK